MSVFTGTVQASLIDSNMAPVGTSTNPVTVQLPKLPSLTRSLSVNLSTAGNNTLVTGLSGQVIKVFALSIFAQMASPAVVVNFTAGPILYSAIVQPTNTAPFSFGLAVNYPSYLFQVGNGINLVANLSAAAQFTVNITYWMESVG